jgi:hypothetical protein
MTPTSSLELDKPSAALDPVRVTSLDRVPAAAVSAIVGRVMRKHMDETTLDAAKVSSII